MRSRLLLLLATLLLSHGVCAPAHARHGAPATTRGAVVTPTGEALPGANVVKAPRLGIAAGEDGRFEIARVPAGASTLRASGVGYTSEPKTVTGVAGETQTVNFELAPEVYSVGEGVVVTATPTEHAVSTAPASISVVSGEELEERPVADLTDAVRGLAGAYIAGESGQRFISIRGLNSNYTLILVDGKRISSQQLIVRDDDLDFSQVPVRGEATRGSMWALYDSEALGGVINIITKPVAADWSGSVGADFLASFDGEGGQDYRTSVNGGLPSISDRCLDQNLVQRGFLEHGHRAYLGSNVRF